MGEQLFYDELSHHFLHLYTSMINSAVLVSTYFVGDSHYTDMLN